MTTLGPGARVGSYRVVRQLGRGGMGAVYEAHDDRLRRAVALKVVLAELAADERLVRRFDREARAAARVRHPNVAALHEAGRAGELLFLVFELLEGGTLGSRLRDGRRLPWQDAARIGAGIAAGLEAIHEAGFVHRDMKPENVMFDRAGTPKITDFGLARREEGGERTLNAPLTRMGEILGTPAYMSPEQADGQPVDARSDVYALGATLHAMLTGAPPFTGDGYAILKRVLIEKPRSVRETVPGVPEPFARLVLRLLEKDPARRGDARQAATELAALAEGFEGDGDEDAPRSSRALVVVTLLLVVVALAAGAAAFFLHSSAEPPAPAPEPLASPPPPPAPPPPPPVDRPAPPSATSIGAARERPRRPGGRRRRALKAEIGPTTEIGPNGAPFEDEPDTPVPFTLVATWGSYQATHRSRGATAYEPTGKAYALMVSPDGEWLATGSSDGVVHFWDRNLEPTWRVKMTSAGLVRCFVALDAKTLFAGGQFEAKLSDWTGEEVNHGYVRRVPVGRVAPEILKPDKAATVLSIATNGEVVVAGGHKTRREGRLECRSRDDAFLWQKDLRSPATAIAFAPADPSRFVVGQKDGSVSTWRLAAADATAEPFLRTEGKGVADLVFVDDDRFLVGPDSGPIELWSLAKGKVRDLGAPRATLWQLAYVRGGTHIAAAGDDGALEVFDLESGACVRELRGHTEDVTGVAFAPGDPRRLYSCSKDSTVRLWDVEKGEQIERGSGHASRVFKIEVSPDGRRAVTTGQDRTVRVWDVATRTLLGAPAYDDRSPRSVAFSPGGARALIGAAGDTERGAEVVALDLGEPGAAPTRVAKTGGTVVGLSLLDDDTFVAATWQDRKVSLLSLRSAEPRAARSFDGPDGYVRAMARARDRVLVGLESGECHVLGPLPGLDVLFSDSLDGKQCVLAAALSPDGKLGAVGTIKGDVRLWSFGAEIQRQTVDAVQHGLRVNALLYWKDDELMVAGEDGVLRGYAPDGTERWRWRLPRHDAPTTLARKADGGVLVGTARGVILELERR